jgi:hypothetical protein
MRFPCGKRPTPRLALEETDDLTAHLLVLEGRDFGK